MSKKWFSVKRADKIALVVLSCIPFVVALSLFFCYYLDGIDYLYHRQDAVDAFCWACVIIALLISIFDILPVLGTGGIMIPWSIISLITGDVRLGILLAIVYIVVTVIRNIIEPKIVGQQLGLHPLVTLVSMFIGVNIAGIVGLFGFPILLSLLVHLNSKGVISLYKVD